MQLRLTVPFVLIALRGAGAQATIPVVTLPAAQAKSSETLGAVLGIRQVANGAVLVDDAGRRQVRLFDPTLATATTVIDSASGNGNSYGRRPAPFIPYLADSTLLPDYSSRTLLVIDPAGRVARSLALPTATDIGNVRRGAVVDGKGRVYYLGNNAALPPTPPDKTGRMSDSVPLLRADLDLRRTDTVAHLARPLGRTSAVSPDGTALMNMWTVDPIRTIDDWAVLTDGSIAVVRGADYHIDWIRPDSSRTSTPKMPFDWRRLSDDDKARMVDSTRAQLNREINDGSVVERVEQIEILRGAAAGLPPVVPGSAPPAGGGRSGSSGRTPFAGFTVRPTDVTPADQLADYLPAIRSGAVMADADNHLWILPTTSKESKQGELVYDVVNSKGELFQRVRVPLGRLIVGFGTGGTVYMTSGDRVHGYYLERSTLPR